MKKDSEITLDNCYENCVESKQSLFYNLVPKEKEILDKNHTCLSYKKNDVIFKEGEKPTGLICLVCGKVKIFKEGVGGREQIIRMAKPLGFIGYRALFAEENYHASAVAIENCAVCVFDKDNLFELLKNNSSLTFKILNVLAAELGFSNERTVALTQKHIRGRLAETLLLLKDKYSFENDSMTIKVYLSREDIANLSNMTTSNAIRTLSIFAQENIISIDGRKIKILDMSKLERISELG